MKRTNKLCIVALIFVVCLTVCFAFAGCDKDKTDAKKVVKEDMVYYLDELTLWGANLISVADLENTYLKLGKDGNLEMKIVPNPTVLVGANLALASMNKDKDIINISPLDVYIKGLFPQNGINDIRKTIARLAIDLGLEIGGVDYEDPMIAKMVESINEKGTIPYGTTIPKEIYFMLKGKYELKEIVSETQDKPFRAVYFGEGYIETSEPYIILTQFTDETGKECIRIRNELLSLDAVASVRAPKNEQ